ncbi:MAG: zf-HC2 domain-containing protein [Bacillota bacterium]|nr:zf-HC2 domain-containing protein [Bacillota bacterium]
MLSCREITELLDLYLDRELEEGVSGRVKAHLEICETCKALLDRRLQEAEMIRAGFPVPELAPGFTKKVMTRICSTPNGPRFFPSLGRTLAQPWLAPVLAGFLILVSLYGISSFDSFFPTPSSLPAPNQVTKDFTAETKNRQRLDSTSSPESAPENEHLSGGQSQDAKESPAEMLKKRVPSGGVTENNQNDGSWSTRGAPKEIRDYFFGTGDLQAEPELFSGAQSERGREKLLQLEGISFAPAYLPPGFRLESTAFPPPGKGGEPDLPQIRAQIEQKESEQESERETPEPRERVVILYSNPHTGDWITLEINRANPFEFEKLPAPSDREAGGESRIAWYAQKEGRHFILVLSGTVPYQELRKVADSIQ